VSTIATTGKRLLLPEETWKRLRISRASFYRLVRRGEIPAVRVGGQLRVPEDELERWLYAEPSASPAGPSESLPDGPAPSTDEAA